MNIIVFYKSVPTYIPILMKKRTNIIIVRSAWKGLQVDYKKTQLGRAVSRLGASCGEPSVLPVLAAGSPSAGGCNVRVSSRNEHSTTWPIFRSLSFLIKKIPTGPPGRASRGIGGESHGLH